ncbi:hypothetical protein MCERE19_00691 [Spirosomataceae bacterium]
MVKKNIEFLNIGFLINFKLNFDISEDFKSVLVYYF